MSKNTKVWRDKHGRAHRKRAPAIVYPNGRRVWVVHGRTHREDGPAIEAPDGSKQWYLRGVPLRREYPSVNIIRLG